MMKASTILAIGLILAPFADAMDTTSSAAGLLRGLAGTWRGELAYRDYQTDQRTVLPVTRTVTLLKDRMTVSSVSAFDDGGSGTVYIASLEGLDAETGAWQTASIRTNRSMQTSIQTIGLAGAAADATHWTVILTEDGEDDDAPATIRETVRRDGDRLSVLREVDPKGDGRDIFAFRNETTLTRQP